MKKLTGPITIALMVIIAALAFTIGLTLGHRQQLGLNKVSEVWNIISSEYVEPERINTENISSSAIEGMIAALNDPYTAYLDAETFEIGTASLEGEFSGIGAYVTLEDDQITIVTPIAGSPADLAGVKAGDIILEINGESVADMSLAEAILKIRGAEGTSVTLLILHENEEKPIEITINRSKFEIPSVASEMMGDIAYIQIAQFSERTDQELSPIIQSLADQNAKGIVLDLRGNPGGLLDTVILVASHFISEGPIVDVSSKTGSLATYEVIQGLSTTDLPMVVLVDESSASGSEVLAGALQDYERAAIAGNTTFGKGSVNILRELSDGSGLYITIARWLTPKGRLIEGQGIEPDYKLELTGEDAVHWAIGFITDANTAGE